MKCLTQEEIDIIIESLFHVLQWSIVGCGYDYAWHKFYIVTRHCYYKIISPEVSKDSFINEISYACICAGLCDEYYDKPEVAEKLLIEFGLCINR